MLDFSSLLIAAGFSAVCLAGTLLAAWRSAKSDGFLLTCAIGATLIAFSVGASALYVRIPHTLNGALAFALLLGGLSTIYGTAWQFRHDTAPWRNIAVACGVTCTLSLPVFMAGYTGIGFVIAYISCAILITLTAYEFWRARAEAPGTLTAIAVLYFLVALSFIPRILFVLLEGKAVIPGQPVNWAEDASLIIVVAVIPGIGAMTMALNQKRLVRRHRREALTDPLSGLLNRRALFDRFEDPLAEPIVVVLFDIDRFKNINDAHGHAMGDKIIALFAQALREKLEPGHIAARLGGEEFVLIRPDSDGPDADGAASMARQAGEVRKRFAELTREEASLPCTVSAGLATGRAHIDTLDAVLAAADAALYDAKRGGRDRLVIATALPPPGPSTIARQI